MRKIFVAILFFILMSAGSLPAQQTQPQQNQPSQSPGKIAVEVKTVSVLATVRDKHGKIISNLAKDDFVLEEDGRPQNINYFVRESGQPLRLGPGGHPRHRRASGAFWNRSAAPVTAFSIICCGRRKTWIL